MTARPAQRQPLPLRLDPQTPSNGGVRLIPSRRWQAVPAVSPAGMLVRPPPDRTIRHSFKKFFPLRAPQARGKKRPAPPGVVSFWQRYALIYHLVSGYV